MDISQKILSDIVIFQKYSKWIKEISRRENWIEICERNMVMHIRKYPQLKEEIKAIYRKYVFTKKVLPSMRSMQFGGLPIELSNSRLYNCAFTNVDDISCFSETAFNLLSGSGVGYSVQQRHISKLPVVKGPTEKTRKFLIGDSIEGWGDSIKVLVKAYFLGKSDPLFDYRDIRPKGAELITSGGKAPGPDPLRICLDKIRSVLNGAIGRQLTSLEVHDIMCHIADAVLSGGIRRAAMIALFSKDDLDMLYCKTGAWWELNPQRGRANNSVLLLRGDVTKDEWDRIWSVIKNSGSGEPGFIWTTDLDSGLNPCCFTADTQIAVADGRNSVSIGELAEESNGIVEFPVYSARYSGNKWVTEIKSAVAKCTGEKPVVLVTLSNGDQFRCTDDHLLAKTDGSYVMTKDSIGVEIEKFFSVKNKYRTIKSFTNGYARQYRMMWEFANGEKPLGLEIDHIDNSAGDFIDNLQLISREEHLKKTSLERMGENNPVFRLRDKEIALNNLSRATSHYANPRYCGLTDGDLISIGKECVELGHTLNYENCRKINAKFPLSFSKNRFGGNFNTFRAIVNGTQEYSEPIIAEHKKYEATDYSYLTDSVFVVSIEPVGVEKIYDLQVEDNHNFYILTSAFDDKAIETRGILVHNSEIGLRSNQFCNLTSINSSDVETQEELNDRVKAAAFLGTLQAGYTDFHYLRSIWKENCEEEALIGVSMTGIASNSLANLNTEEAADCVKKENARVAALIGINPAARTTCVKPEGSLSCVVGSSSGIHAWHAAFYKRRIRIGKNEAIYSYLKSKIPDLIEDCVFKPHIDAVLTIPQKAPEGAILRTEPVINLLSRIKEFNLRWVRPGHRSGEQSHNVSATVSIKDDEWEFVGEWMWDNKEHYTGISVLPFDAGTYQQAPFEDCDEEEFNRLFALLQEINLDEVHESTDATDLKDQAACGGGACEVK